MTTTGNVPECPVNESFDPLAPDFLADPYAVMAALPRDEQPIFFAPSIGYYVLTRYADIEQVFKDPAAYSAAAAQGSRAKNRPRLGEAVLPAIAALLL
jgi:cytochrome P450